MKKRVKKQEVNFFKGGDVKSFQYKNVGRLFAPVEGVELGMFLVILNEHGDLMILDMESLVALTVKSFIEKHGHKDFQKHLVSAFEVE